MNDPTLRTVPMVLETEKDTVMTEDIQNMNTLKSLVE